MILHSEVKMCYQKVIFAETKSVTMSRTIRERQKECNTLVCLLTGVMGHHVTVELRNETKVTGV